MRRASKQLEVFSRSVIGVTTKLLKFGGAMAAVATGGAALLIRSSFKSIDLLAKVSDKLGISTEKLGAYRFAAKQAGVAMVTFDMALQRMARRVSEAAVGTGEAQAALKELGVDATRLAALPLDQQFRELMEALDGVAGSSDRVRLGFKLFDSEGVALINMAKGGASALDKMEATFMKLGGGFKRASVELVVQATDAISRLQEVFKIGAGNLAIAMAPFVTAAADAFTDAIASGDGFRNAMIKNAEAIARAFDIALTTIRLMHSEMQRKIVTPFQGRRAAATAGINTFLGGLFGAAEGFREHGLRGISKGFMGGLAPAPADIDKFTGFRAKADESNRDREIIERRHGAIGRLYAKILADAMGKAADATRRRGREPPAFQGLPSILGMGGGGGGGRATQFREVNLDRLGLGTAGPQTIQRSILQTLKQSLEAEREALRFWRSQNQFLPVTV